MADGKGRTGRRTFLGATLAGTALPVLAGCGDDDADGATPDEETGVFRHGVASGDPLPDAVILWTRVTVPDAANVEVTWEIATDPSFEGVVGGGTVTTTEDVDFTVKLDVTGLSAGSTYYYRFSAAGEVSPVGRTKTAPVGEVTRLRFAIVSCASLAHGYFHVYRNIAERPELDAVLHLGDYIYEYESGGYGEVRDYDPPHEIVTLDDYRRRYRHYRRDADLQEVHRQHPFIAVWDDHEFANDAWMHGAENHNPTEEGDFADRRRVATRAYMEWMPIRAQEGDRIFRKLAFGDLADLFMLDTRIWGRDEQANTVTDPRLEDESRTILGMDQEAWLHDGLRTSVARYRLLGQQVMMAPLPISQIGNTDQWDGYPGSRARLYEVIEEEGVDNVVVLTGDIHTSWASDLVPDEVEYDEETGAGSIAVELITPSVTSVSLPSEFRNVGLDVVRSVPTIKLCQLTQRGYIILDVTPERAEGAFFHVESVDTATRPEQTVYGVFATYAGTSHLVPHTEPAAPPEGPPLAP